MDDMRPDHKKATVDRIARALHTAEHAGSSVGGWKRLTRDEKDRYRRMARAALEQARDS